MRNNKVEVIISQERHEELLKKEELWNKYKDEHAYAGTFRCTIRSVWGFKTPPVKALLMSVNEEYTPNTPQEIIDKIEKEAEFLRRKMDEIEETNKEDYIKLKEKLEENYAKIPRWIQKLFI